MAKVFNGNTVGMAMEYLDEHFRRLEEIVKAIREQETSEEYARRKFAVLLDGTGNGILRADVPQGYDWTLQRVTLTSPANGIAQIFVDTTNLSDLVEEIGSSQVYSDGFANNIYVPGGSPLFVVFTGAGPNGTATVNLQLKIIKRRAHTHQPVATWAGDA